MLINICQLEGLKNELYKNIVAFCVNGNFFKGRFTSFKYLPDHRCIERRINCYMQYLHLHKQLSVDDRKGVMRSWKKCAMYNSLRCLVHMKYVSIFFSKHRKLIRI